MKGLCVVFAVNLVHLCHGLPKESARKTEQDNELVVLNYVPTDGVPLEMPPYRIGSYGDISENKLSYGSPGNRYAEDFYPRIRKRRFLGDFVSKAVEGVKNVGRGIKAGVKTVGRTIKSGVKNAGRRVKQGVKTVGRTIKSGATNAGRRVKQGVKTVGRTIKSGVKNAGRRVKEGVKTVGRKIWEGR